MDTAREYVYEIVQKLVSDNKRLKASIHFESLSNAYYIDLQPSDIYNSKDLRNIRLAILDDFYDQNFNASLHFINDNSLLELKSYECHFTGEQFVDINQVLCFADRNTRELNNEVLVVAADSMIYGEFDYAMAA